MIEIRDFSVSYGKHLVLDQLYLSLSTPGVHGIVGLNGSGKTTLFNAIFGSVGKTAGEIRMNGSVLAKRQVGYLETQPFFYPRSTGREYLELFQIANPSFDVEGWNKVFNLPLDALTETYSTGMKKQLAFLGIIGLGKDLLLLDEPFNGVDLESSQKLKLIIRRLAASGKTMLLTSHIIETLTGTCNTISYLKAGKISFTAPQEEFETLETRIFELGNKETEALLDGLLG